ncbi:hypothetical protein Clacol_000153 [Clathrus columnatus]|uniref:Uncharacterized protein n=1 Tax=Clathrus columnatus TaxID=1419009 RepID=A0AAV4ZZ04_9AGAM|nr:hypothetical protein Clacol_000153 [Clathrus columnatus]
MVKEILLRSHTLPLDLTIYNFVPLLHELQAPDANRVRTLRLGPRTYIPYPPSSYFTSLFPSLTMVFFEDRFETIDLSIQPLPLFQALEARIKNLGNLALPNHFPNLWWLHLRYELTLPLFSLLEALQNLPCLRVLHLFPQGSWWDLPDLPKGLTITFHHLEALITGSPILHLITTPRLSYLQCTQHPENFFMSNENYGHLCRFDFSKITHIQIGINCYELSVYVMGKFKEDTSDDDTTPFMVKNYHKWTAFNEITSSYPNEFYIQVDSSSVVSRSFTLFAAIVKKSSNLDEITLNYHYLNPSGMDYPSNR